MIPLAVLPGTGVPDSIAQIYYRHWLQAAPAELIGLPDRGLVRLQHTYAALEPKLFEFIERQGQRVVLVGHSQGAYHAVRFALNNPGHVMAVIGVAGPFGGVHTPWVPRLLSGLAQRVLPIAEDFAPESLILRGLSAAVARGWPSHVPLTLVTGDRDAIVHPRRSAHQLESGAIRKVYVGPVRPRTLPLSTEHARSFLTGHCSLVFSGPVQRIIREARGM